MKLRHKDKGRRICPDLFVLEKIVVQGAQGRKLSALSPFIVCIFVSFFLIIGKVLHIFFNIAFCDLIQNRQGKFGDFHFGKRRISAVQKFKKHSQIVGVGKACAG